MKPPTSIAKLLRRAECTAGFTMAEMMMGTGIGAIVLTGVLTTYTFSLRGFRAISNYAEIHRGGRKSVDFIARDMRGVSSISSFTPSNIVVVIPTAFSSTGSVISNKTVTYSVSNGKLYRTDSSTGFTDMLATNIYQLTFTLYDKLGSNTTVLTSAKGIQVQIRLRKYVMSQIQSEDYLSARWDMRNIP